MKKPLADAPIIVWFRKDLRLIDNPALCDACSSGRPLVLVYILDDDTHVDGDWAVGSASRWWLDASLRSLQKSLADRGASLTLRRGVALDCVNEVIAESGATRVVWNRCYETNGIERDRVIKQKLDQASVEVESFNGALLNEPWQIKTGSGSPYLVFTPYWKAILRRGIERQPEDAPSKLNMLDSASRSDRLEDWNLTPSRPDWAAGLRENWTPGEQGAWESLKLFLDERVGRYSDGRDRPDQSDTSMLSAHLHFGEISPVSVWHETVQATDGDNKLRDEGMAFLREIGWREFCHSLLFYNPTLPDANLKPAFDAFTWLDDEVGLLAWQKGLTGFPIIDAGMRQLWHSGWMHNRVRMIAASFLIKDLMVHWRHGERWFWDTLVDADLANNAAGWQWVAGSGADASPYFRVFNPTTQGKKFDPDGVYVRRWVPELASLPDRYIHEPSDAPEDVLTEAGIELGTDYPMPLVDHKQARLRALEAYEQVRAK